MWTIILFTQFLIAIFGLLGDPFIGAMDGNGFNENKRKSTASNESSNLYELNKMKKLNPNEHVGMPNAPYHQFTQDSWSFDEIWQQYQEEEKAKKPMEELKQHPSGRSPQDSWPDDQTDVLMEEIWQKVDKEENGGRTRQQLESADGQHATTAIAFNKRQHPLNILKEKSVGFETNTKEHINEWASSASASASQSASWCGDIKFDERKQKYFSPAKNRMCRHLFKHRAQSSGAQNSHYYSVKEDNREIQHLPKIPKEKLDILLASRNHGRHQYHIDSRALFSTTFHCNKVGCTGAMVIYNGERLRLTALHTCKADKNAKKVHGKVCLSPNRAGYRVKVYCEYKVASALALTVWDKTMKNQCEHYVFDVQHCAPENGKFFIELLDGQMIQYNFQLHFDDLNGTNILNI